MPANTIPIYPITPHVSSITLLTADTNFKTPATNGKVLVTAGTNGTRIDAVKVRALGTNVATVLRIFWNDGLGVEEANFSLVYEVELTATTVQTSKITGVDTVLLPINYANDGNGVLPPALNAGQKLYVSLGTTVASGYAVTFMGGDY
ncbi:hypothetical protein [Ruminiclostridium cellulolyticum]|uniref:Uncharacterized protein n=1 Tax=Ruminiclostridium cellulolyticum (strain ATCC 35319 / DSM 5812 / JCM 6584 / H10) TaxID=394503 RepID=B8I8Y9_RUMCH|nr:hypothetical protein [Ruminiclostridium cellulolyticum]ACL77321.1 hypothetical protein Ccel_3029 [Ruminiclostridium cellulolyticum H10]